MGWTARKKEGGATPSRARSRSRSPGRASSTPKSPRSRSRTGRSPGRPRGRSRSRSASVGRHEEPKESKPKNSKTTKAKKTKEEAKEETGTTQFVTRMDAEPKDEEQNDVLLRSTLAALAPVVREQPSVVKEVTTTTVRTTVAVAYEEESHANDEDEKPLLRVAAPRATSVLSTLTKRDTVVTVTSVAAVVASLVVSQLQEEEGEPALWRRALPALIPIVALLLFLHQRDPRASAKWVAIALAWRCAAETLVLLGDLPEDFWLVALASGGVANLALLIAFVAGIRSRDHVNAKASLVLLVVGITSLFLADRYDARRVGLVDRIQVDSFRLCMVQLGHHDREPGARVPRPPHVGRSGE